MRMWEILADTCEHTQNLDKRPNAKISEMRSPLTLRDINRMKKMRKFGEFEKSKRQDLLVAMYGQPEPETDGLKVQKMELDVAGKRLANTSRAMDVRRKKLKIDSESSSVAPQMTKEHQSRNRLICRP